MILGSAICDWIALPSRDLRRRAAMIESRLRDRKGAAGITKTPQPVSLLRRL
jgi:hypothetical protein